MEKLKIVIAFAFFLLGIIFLFQVASAEDGGGIGMGGGMGISIVVGDDSNNNTVNQNNSVVDPTNNSSNNVVKFQEYHKSSNSENDIKLNSNVVNDELQDSADGNSNEVIVLKNQNLNVNDSSEINFLWLASPIVLFIFLVGLIYINYLSSTKNGLTGNE